MKTLGLIGGMSWESTALYYSALNRGVAGQLGGLHSAKMVLGNVDFQEIVDFQKADRWFEAGVLLSDVAKRLVDAGAEALALAVNTMHKVAPQIATVLDVPFLDIRDAVAKNLKAHDMSVCGLLGTGYVMEQDFYRHHVEQVAGCEVLTPDATSSSDLNRIIYGELSRGVVENRSREMVLELIGALQRRGAQGIILGCTELPMLALSEHSPIPLFDSTALHVEFCLDFMLGQGGRNQGQGLKRISRRAAQNVNEVSRSGISPS